MRPKLKATRDQKIREAWQRGRLRYKLHSGQHRILDAFLKAKYQLFVGECARQLGKTILEAILALEMAIGKPKSKTKIGTAFQTDLLEFIIPAFDFVLRDCPDDLRPSFKSQKSKYVFRNGSEIKLIGLDRKPNGLRGTVIDLIILSEAGFISNLHYLFKSVIIPATTHRPDCRVLMLSTPPETPAHEFLDYVEKAEYEGAYIKLTIYSNPLIDQETIDRLMKESGGPNSTTWRREYLCEHITDANLAIISGWDEKYVENIPRDQFYPFYHKYDAMDLGVKDNTAVIFGYYDFVRALLIIEDEYVINGPDLTTVILKKDIEEKEKGLWGETPKVYLRISDNNNPLLLQDLSHLHKLHFVPTDKGSLEEMVNTVKIMVDSGRIRVHERCKQLRGCLKYGVWDKNRSKFAQSLVYGHFDALAALIYLVRNLNQSTNPIPPDFQLDKDNQILFIHQRESEQVRKLKNAFGFTK
jgi:hypothetical protein